MSTMSTIIILYRIKFIHIIIPFLFIIFILFIFIIQTTPISTSIPKLLSIELKPNFGAYYAELSLGNPPQTIYHGLDQGLTVTWTDVFKYSPSKSSTHQIIKQGDLKFQHLHLYGNEVKDSMHFPNNTTLPNFSFYTIKDSRGYNSRVGGFGLAHKFTDYKYSLVHQLHNEGLITKRSFAFVPPSSTNNQHNLNNQLTPKQEQNHLTLEIIHFH